MRRLVLGLLVLGALVLVPSAPAAKAYTIKDETYLVPTRHGDI